MIHKTIHVGMTWGRKVTSGKGKEESRTGHLNMVKYMVYLKDILYGIHRQWTDSNKNFNLKNEIAWPYGKYMLTIVGNCGTIFLSSHIS